MSKAETSDYLKKQPEKAPLLEDTLLEEKQGTVQKAKGIFTKRDEFLLREPPFLSWHLFETELFTIYSWS